MFPNRMKRDYIKHRDTISATGQGLIQEDRESEFEPGSQLANIWGMGVAFLLTIILTNL